MAECNSLGEMSFKGLRKCGRCSPEGQTNNCDCPQRVNSRQRTIRLHAGGMTIDNTVPVQTTHDHTTHWRCFDCKWTGRSRTTAAPPQCTSKTTSPAAFTIPNDDLQRRNVMIGDCRVWCITAAVQCSRICFTGPADNTPPASVGEYLNAICI